MNCFRIEGAINPASFGIQVDECSLLINVGQAMFNLSAFVRLAQPNEQDRIVMTVSPLKNSRVRSFDHQSESKPLPLTTAVFEPSSLSIVSVTNPTFAQPQSLVDRIPAGTRYLWIQLSCDVSKANNQYCVFDQVHFSIFQNLSGS